MSDTIASEAAPTQLICSQPGCGQTFRRRDYLARHEAMHTDVRPYQCELCSKSFGRSDVLARHRKKCTGPTATQRRSISPYSPSRTNQAPPPRKVGDKDGRHGPEYASILGILPDIESRLPLIPVTGSGGKRKRHPPNDSGEADEDSQSDMSVESQVLNERTGGGQRSDLRNQTSVRTAEARAPKQSRRMPILDVDFPIGTVAAATTLASVANPPPAQSLNRLAESEQRLPPPQPLHHEKSTAPMHSFWSSDSPLDLNWLGGMGMGSGGSADGQPGSNFEAYLPDTFFDFEAFLSSTLGDSDVMSRGTSFLTSTPNHPAAGSTSGATGMSAPDSSGGSLLHADHTANPIGSPTPIESVYHIPIDRFKAYYQMSHWRLPPLVEMVSYAERTRNEILPHFGFLHLPTFRLDMLATCLAFTLCVVGADLPVLAGSTKFNEDGIAGDQGGGWDFGPMVRNEMTIMIMKSFSVSKRMTMSDYNLSLNQSLLLLQASEILSEHSHERMRANMFRTTIVNTARQLECYNPRSSHFRHEIRLPIQPWTFAELDLHWRRWIQLEVRRRTTYFIFIFDMLATIETSIPCICSPSEVCYIPLPAPSSLWNAPGGECWLAAAKAFTPVSLDGALRVLFTAPFGTSMPGSEPTNNANNTARSTSGNQGQLHPVSRLLDRFAMHVIVLMLLRGVIEIGEGRRERGDWYDLTDLWLDREEADEWIARSFRRSAGRNEVLEVYTGAIQMWKTWWDALPPVDTQEKTTRPALCEDALPIFWLVQALLGVLASSTPVEVRRAFITRINFAEMLNSARNLTREHRDTAGPEPTRDSGAVPGSGSVVGGARQPCQSTLL